MSIRPQKPRLNVGDNTIAAYPGAVATFSGFTSSHTLAADSHAAQHNLEQGEIVAVQTKVGTGSSTPTNNTVLRGNGAGSSAWAQVGLTTDVTGILPVANGGLGQGTLTGLTLPAAILTSSPTLTTPVIGDFTNANHNHQNAAGGGKLGESALTLADVVTNDASSSAHGFAPKLWASAWQAWTPTLTNITAGNGTTVAKYMQIGKTIHYRFLFTLGSTSAIATNPEFSLPVAIHADYAATVSFSGFGMMFDADGSQYPSLNDIVATANTTRFTNLQSPLLAVTSTAPFTWATGDSLWASGTYEAA